MELELGVQITRPVEDLTFASTETDAVFILFAHLPGFMKDEIEVELNEAGTEISISSRGETGERSFIETEISGRIKISHEESMEGFRKAFPIPNNVILDRVEVGFEEEEGILFVLLPKSTREEEPSRVEMGEINERNIREEEEEEEEEEERTSMTGEAEETTPDYNEEKAQEQKNLGEVEPKKSTEKLEGKPDGKPNGNLEASHREATTKIAIEDKEDKESELIIEELDFLITPYISEKPITFKSSEEEEEERNTLEEEASEQKDLDELELSKSSKALESEPEGETEPNSIEIAIRAQTDDKEEGIGVIIEEPDFTITPPPLEKPIISEASEAEGEEEEKALEKKEQKQETLNELKPKRSSRELEGESDEEIKPERKELAIEVEIINDDEEESELIIEKPDFTISSPSQKEPIESNAFDSKEEEEEEKERTIKKKLRDQESLDELRSKKSLEVLEGKPDGQTKPEHREMTIEVLPSDKEEEKARFIIEEPDSTKTPPLEEPVASKAAELKEEEEKATKEKVPTQKNLDEQEPKEGPEALEGKPDRETKPEHREMAIEAQTGNKEEEKTGLIIKDPDFTRIPPLSEEQVASKTSELKEEKEEKATEEKVLKQKDLHELEPKEDPEALESEPDRETKPEHRETAIEAQNGDKEEEKTELFIKKPDFTGIPPPSKEPVAPKDFELREEEEEKAIEEKVLKQKDLDELEPKEGPKVLEGEPDRETKPQYREKTIRAQTGDKEEEKTKLIIEELDFTRIPPPSEEPVVPKASELKEEEKEKATEEKVLKQKNLDELESKEGPEALEGEPHRETKLEYREPTIEAQTGNKEEEKTGLIVNEPDFTRIPPPSEELIAPKASKLKEEEWMKAIEEIVKQKDLDELESKEGPEALEGEPDKETKSEYRETTIEAQTDDKKEEKTRLIIDEPNFTKIPHPLEEPVAPKVSELTKKEGKKATEEKVLKQKDLDELEPKKGPEALQGEPDREIKPESRETTIEAQTDDKEKDKTRLIIEEPNFTRIPNLLEEPVAPKASELKEEEEKATEEKVLKQKDLDELEPKEGPEALKGEPDEESKLEYRETKIEAHTGDKEEEKTRLIIEEPDFTRIPPLSEKPIAPKASELKEEEEEKATEEKVLKQKDLDKQELKEGPEALEGEPDRETKPEYIETTIKAQTGDKEEEKTRLIIEAPDCTRIPPPSEELVAPKTSELKEKEREKATEEKVLKQKDLDEVESKKGPEALEGEPDGETKPESRETKIEAQIGDKEEKKTRLIIEKPNFTRMLPPSEEPIAPKASELKEEEEEKATKEKVLKQKDLDKQEPKEGPEALEGEPDRKTKPEYRETTIEAQTGDKEEEKTRLIIESPDFTRIPPLSEELVAPKTSELKEEEEEKATEEKVLKQKDLDELESKEGPEALEGKPDGETKSKSRETTIEAQTGDKEEEKTRLIIEEPDLTRIPTPLEEPVAPKASELKEEGKKTKEEKVLKQKDFDELESKEGPEALKGEPNEKTKSEHRDMTIEAQISDKEGGKRGLTREKANLTITPPSEEPIASNAFEIKEEEEKAAREEVPEQKNLNKLEPKKVSKALEGEPDGKTRLEHEAMAIETQTNDKEEEQTGFIIEEPNFNRTLPSTKEPLASKDSELKKEEEKATKEKVLEHTEPDKLDPKKISEAQEGEFDRETRAEYEEMAIEAQTDYKEVAQTELIKEEPDFTKKPPLLTELVTSKASELKKEGEKTVEEKAQEQKSLDEVELEKGLETLEGELDGDIEPKPIEMTTEALSEHKEEEPIGINTEKPEFTIAPPSLEKSILFNASKLKEEEKNKAHGEDTEEPKNFEEKIQSYASKEEEKEEKEKALEEKPQKQRSLDELIVKKSLEELEGEPHRETEVEPKKPAIEMQTEYQEEEKTGFITEEPDFTAPPTLLEDLIASKASKSKEEEEEQQEEAPTKETPHLPPISPILMAEPELNQEQLDTTDSHEEQDREVEVPGRALETSESAESPKQEEDRHGFGEEDAKEPKDVEEIAYDPAPKTLTKTVTPEDVDSDRRSDGERETRETETRALPEDDREIASDVDGGEDGSREEEEGESSDRDREESWGEMETGDAEKENNENGMNRRREKAPKRSRRRRRRRGSSFEISPAGAVASSAFILTFAALVIRLIKKRRSHAVR